MYGKHKPVATCVVSLHFLATRCHH